MFCWGGAPRLSSTTGGLILRVDDQELRILTAFINKPYTQPKVQNYFKNILKLVKYSNNTFN
jgi:hypothetical protein